MSAPLICDACGETMRAVVDDADRLLQQYNDAVVRAQGVLCAYAGSRARLAHAARLQAEKEIDKTMGTLDGLYVELKALRDDIKTRTLL